ncbi:MAG: SBBP repeat-containing protein, partial [Flavobacteriales bacterium]|nr:SBBP repeat-containing protein [Flavobacteriales bacterium]
MKIKLLFSFLFVLFFQQVNAQNSRVWSTYYGGAIYDVANCVVTDASGNVYMAGFTSSTSGIASGGFQNTYGGGTYDAFLVKFDASGNRIWATYYGGNNTDFANDIAIDDAGNVYLVGGTKSTSGIASGGFQNTHGGGSYDGFLVKFDSAGNRIWSTYYGGTGWEEARSISTDTTGNVYITGFTSSTNSIASGGFQNTYAGGTYDSFLVKFNAAGNRLWATYYGGPGNEGYDGNGVATDNFGNVYLTGWTSSLTGISSGGFQNSLGGATDVFLVKFDSAGSRVWATYYGGTGNEGAISNILHGKNVATDLFGNIYLSGTTQSTTGIASSGFQNTFGGGTNDCYLVKFDSTGNRNWGTYYGGAGDERGWGVTTDAAGNAYLTGRTNSTSDIASGGFQTTNFGNYDAFLVTFSPSGSRHCATYYGGTGGEWVYAPAIDPFGNIYLSGFTFSTSGITSGGFQNTFAGGTYDAFLVKFTSCAPSAQCSISFQVNDVTCSGTCDGSATALVTGGTSPYTYSWTPTGQNTPTIAGLCAGNYSCTVTANGVSCTDSVTVVANIPTTSTTAVLACDSYTWNNTIYTSSGTYTWLGTNAAGCDSTATLNLSITPVTTTGSVTTSICAGDSYTWPANGVTYTTAQSGTTYDSGCNTATLNLSITPATTTGSVTTSICDGDSYTWPANGVSYTTAQSGTTYTSGCNTATLNFIVTQPTSKP